ncbi:MAG: hypothetical protein AAB916_01355 [Patescibacteria group bacterium]
MSQENKNDTSRDEGAVAGAPLREGLREAEEIVSGIRLGRVYNSEGVLDTNQSSTGGLRNYCARLNLAENLLDVEKTYGERGVEEKDIARLFISAVQRVDAYGGQGGRVSDTEQEIYRISRGLVRLSVQGRLEGSSNEAEADNMRMLSFIKQALHPVMKEREDRSLDAPTYREKALPMLTALNHVYAAYPFLHLKPSEDARSVEDRLLSQRSTFSHEEISGRVLPLQRFITDLAKNLGKEDYYNAWQTDEKYIQRIRALGERMTALEERLGAEHMGKITFFTPGLIDYKNDTHYGWADPQIIDMTLDLLEDQIDFLERNANAIYEKTKNDSAEAREKISENERRKNFEVLKPELDAVARLEHDTAAEKDRSDLLEAARERQQGFVAACEAAYHRVWERMHAVKKPFFLARNREGKYLDDMKQVVQEVVRDLRALNGRAEELAVLLASAAKEKPYSGTGVRFNDVYVPEGGFTRKRDELQVKHRDLLEGIASLRRAAGEGMGKAQQDQDKAHTWLAAAQRLTALWDAYEKNPTGDAEKYFRDTMDALSDRLSSEMGRSNA